VWDSGWFAADVWPWATWVFSNFWPALAIGVAVLLFFRFADFIITILGGAISSLRGPDAYDSWAHSESDRRQREYEAAYRAKYGRDRRY